MNWKKKLSQGFSSKPDNDLPTNFELASQPVNTVTAVSSIVTQPLSIELDPGAGIHMRIIRAG